MNKRIIRNVFILLVPIIVSIYYIVFINKLDKDVINALNSKNRYETIEYYSNLYKTSIDDKFWTTNFDGTKPSDYLNKKSIDEYKKYEFLLVLGKKYDLVNSKSLKELKKEWIGENIKRDKFLVEGKPIQGVRNYSLIQFIDYTISKLIISLPEKMSEEYFPVNDNILENYYNNNIDIYSKNKQVLIKTLTVPFGPKLKYLNRQEALEKVLELEKKFSNGKSLDDFKDEFEILEFEIKDNSITFSRYQNFFYKALDLNIGEISNYIEEQNNFVFIQLIEKFDERALNFEDVYYFVKKDYLDSKFNEYVENNFNNK